MLERFERAIEGAIEGSLRRVFPSQLQPVQLAKAAARAMEENQVIGVRGPEVPNRYLVQVASADFQRFEPFRQTLAAELLEYLHGYAQDRGLRFIAPPTLELAQLTRLRANEVQVEAQYVDLPPAEVARIEEKLEGTRSLRVRAAEDSFVADGGFLEDSQGRRLELDPAQLVARLGRALDNDFVLDEPSVSRYHAQLRWDGHGWLVGDLQSTNGTRVAGASVREKSVVLRNGDTLELGRLKLTYRPGGPA